MKRKIQLTESELIDMIKRIISEQQSDKKDDTSTPSKQWLEISNVLSQYDNPKVINFKRLGKEITSLNWGGHKDSKSNWGLSLTSEGRYTFQTNNKTQSELFNTMLKEMGSSKKSEQVGKSWKSDGSLDYSNPKMIVRMVKKMIDVLGGKKG